MNGEETLDELRRYGLRLIQPRDGYRYSLDPLLLCAFAGELARGKSKSLYIEQVRTGSSRAEWVCASDKLHNGNCILSDLKRATDTRDVWKRFKQPKRQTAAFYRMVYEALTDSGFNEPIMTELVEAVSELEKWAIRPLGRALDSRSTA